MDELWRFRNVDALAEDPESLLSFYQQLLGFRASSPVLQLGEYREVMVDGNVLVFVRELGDQALTVVLNLANVQVELAAVPRSGSVIFGTHADAIGSSVGDVSLLRAGEGLIVRPG